MTYSIDFPPGFRSRTGSPLDSCYVGRVSLAKPTARPSQAEGVRVKHGSRPWKLWALLVRRGMPMTSAEIAMHLDCRAKDVNTAAAPLIKGEVVKARSVGHSLEYALGAGAVVEMA